MANAWDIILGYAAFRKPKWMYLLCAFCPARPIHPYARLCSSHRRENRHIAKKASIISAPRFLHRLRGLYLHVRCQTLTARLLAYGSLTQSASREGGAEQESAQPYGKPYGHQVGANVLPHAGRSLAQPVFDELGRANFTPSTIAPFAGTCASWVSTSMPWVCIRTSRGWNE